MIIMNLRQINKEKFGDITYFMLDYAHNGLKIYFACLTGFGQA